MIFSCVLKTMRWGLNQNNKMKELISDTHRTVIIVSHSLGTISELCDEVLWLEKGKVIMKGSAEEVIPKYQEFMSV